MKYTKDIYNSMVLSSRQIGKSSILYNEYVKRMFKNMDRPSKRKKSIEKIFNI